MSFSQSADLTRALPNANRFQGLWAKRYKLGSKKCGVIYVFTSSTRGFNRFGTRPYYSQNVSIYTVSSRITPCIMIQSCMMIPTQSNFVFEKMAWSKIFPKFIHCFWDKSVSFSNINLSIGKLYKRNNTKENENPYCNHNMVKKYHTECIVTRL